MVLERAGDLDSTTIGWVDSQLQGAEYARAARDSHRDEAQFAKDALETFVGDSTSGAQGGEDLREL